VPRLLDGAINVTTSSLVILLKYQQRLRHFGSLDIAIARTVFTPVLETVHALEIIIPGSLLTQEKWSSAF